MADNGGLTVDNLYFMVPVKDTNSGRFYLGIFDINNLNDLVASSSYSWRQEDIAKARVPTVHKVILEYRDLGIATLTVTVSGFNDNGTAISISQPTTIGTAAATGNINTTLVDLSITCYRPQLSILRAAAAGPMDIISATIAGEVEEQHF